MATLPRPGVEISQQIITESPTILTPSLVPCLIGPCFQIVKPLTEDGSLNAEAQSSISALLVSNSALGEELNLSGRSMVLNVNGTGNQTIQFPVTLDNEALSQALVENTINKNLSGAFAEFVEDKLVIMTTAKGPTASISVVEVASDSAYGAGPDDILAMNYMVGKTSRGKTAYNNTAYTIPFSSFPSPKTDVSELVIDKDDVALYIYYLSGSPRQLSEDSAVAMNSYHAGDSKFGNVAASAAFQPALNLGDDGRVSLVGKSAPGSKTNLAAHPGTEASLILPLCHDTKQDGTTPLATWPDVTGANSMSVSAIGLSDYLSTGNVSDIGLFSGAEGNDVTVVIVDGGGGGCTATYAAKVLTLTGGPATTFGEVATALSSEALAGQVSGAIRVSMAQGAEDDSVCSFTEFAGTYYLGGGSDPVDFTADASDAKAYVCGATVVGAGTGASLGLTGETISISFDGDEATSITIDAATSIVDSINAAFDHTAAEAVSVTNTLGETIAGCLRIVGASENGHDSTIEISASSSSVIKVLFSGTAEGSESISAASVFEPGLGAGLQDRKFSLLGSSEYNSDAESVMMKAIQPNSVTVEASGIIAKANIILDFVEVADAGPKNLGIKVDGVETVLSIQTNDCDDQATTVSELNTKMAAVDASAMSYGTSQILIFHSSNDADKSLELVAASTDAEFTSIIDASLFDSAVTSEAITAVISDSGNNGAIELVSVSNSSANILALTPPGLTSHGLDLSATGCRIDYSSGNMHIAFSMDAEGVPGSEGAASYAVNASTSLSVTYARAWANNTQAATPIYSGRVFMGMANGLEVSDTVLNNGSVLGRIVGFEPLNGVENAVMVMSEYALDNGGAASGWSVRAENLVSGDGRVAPEIVASNAEKTIVAKHALLRNKAGLPMSNDSAPLYIGYQALRKDVTADTANPQLLVFNSIAEVDTFIGPIDPSNPLAFGMYMAFLNTTNINIAALGVSEVSADAPNGTLEAYAKALDYLEMKEVYALAPLTDDVNVFRKFSQHVTDMSEPAAKKERMAICCPSLPSEKSPILAESGSMTITDIGGGKYNATLNLQSEIDQKTIHQAINGSLDANGETISGADGASYTPDQGIYLDREGDANSYLIVGTPDAATVTIETSDVYRPGLLGPGTGGNDDSFFKSGSDAVSALSSWEVDGEQCTIFIRQAAVDDKTTGGRLAICEGLAEVAGGVTGFQNRRVVLVQPELVGVDFGGMEIGVSGFYLCGAIAAMIGQQTASQPFTNLPMVGFTRPIGSNDKFSENQMSTAAAGGVYWVIQDVTGGALASRHQLTTDVTSLKTRELSILKSVDFVSKTIRNQIKRYIGRKIITRQLLETVSLGLNGALSSVAGSVVAAATLDSIAQDPANPDSISVSISLTPYYPANKISVTIFV